MEKDQELISQDTKPISILHNTNELVETTPLRKPILVGNTSCSGGGDRLKRDEWSEGAVSCLLDAYESKWMLRNRAKLKGHDWEDVARHVSLRANSTKSPKTQTQCKNKIESMKKRYRSESAATDPSSWPLFQRLDLLLRCRTHPTPSSTTQPPPLPPIVLVLDQPPPPPPQQPSPSLPSRLTPAPPPLCPLPPPQPPTGIRLDSHNYDDVDRNRKERARPAGADAVDCASNLEKRNRNHRSKYQRAPTTWLICLEDIKDENRMGDRDEILDNGDSDKLSVGTGSSSTPISNTVKEKLKLKTNINKVEMHNKRKKMMMKKKKRCRGSGDQYWEMAESIRWLAEVVMRSEGARMGALREIEKMRVEAEAKKGEMDLKRTEIIANTQLEIAKILASSNNGNKNIDSSLKIGRN